MLTEEALDEFGTSLVDQIWQDSSDELPEIVYHYTDAAGLAGMLASKKVWATEYRFVNDGSEVELGLQQAKRIVRDIRVKEKNDRKLRFLINLQRLLEQELPNSSFVFSTSSKRDDLSQWRGYAKEGQGFAIGFSAEFKRKMCARKNISFGKVCYNTPKQAKRIKDLVNVFYEFCEKNCPEGITEAETSLACIELDAVIASYAASYKHSSFQNEDEWRLHFYPDADEIRIRVSGTKLIPYAEVDFAGLGGRNPIRSVGIGPGFRAKEHSYALERLLKINGCDAEIYFAKTPFRTT